MGRMFGTDGVRGVANRELTAEMAFRLGQAGAIILSQENRHKPTILIGKDTRISCDMLEGALISGICSVGANAVSLGVIPTPAVSYLTCKYGADAGIVISASHNSFEFNGIKFFNYQGYKLPDETEGKIEALIAQALPEPSERPVGVDIGRHSVSDTAKEDYIEHLLSEATPELSGFKIALDCANGASFEVAPMLFKKLGANVSVIHAEPDGLNINHQCGSTHLESLIEFTRKTGAHVGFAFDGDADRLLVVDEFGNVVDGDAIMAMIAIDLKKQGRLVKNTLVATVMSNLGLEITAKREGFSLLRTAVGDRYVLEEMVRSGYSLGGEQSGHIICLETNTTGDGLQTALCVMRILANGDHKMSDLAKVVETLPQVLRNAKVSTEKKDGFLDDPVISQKCRELEELFHGEGRTLIRPSGTEPLVRVMIEGKDQQLLNEKADELVKIIEERLA